MKKLESTKIRILLCSILVSSIAATHHGATIAPRKKSECSPIPHTIQMPERVMATQEISCLSADPNIFDIADEADKTCRGTSMKCTFYYFANLKYYYIGSLYVNKELFDKLLMKYDNWLLTGEKIPKTNTVVYTKGDEKYFERVRDCDKLHQSDTSTYDEDNSIDIDKYNYEINKYEVIDHDSHSNKQHSSHTKSHSRTQSNSDNSIRQLNVKENNGKYIELTPKYNKKHRYYEVFLPGHEEEENPRTMYVNNNYENQKSLAFERQTDTKSNKLKEDSILDNYDSCNQSQKERHYSDESSINNSEYDDKYHNQNSHHYQRGSGSKDKSFLNKVQQEPLQKTEYGVTNPLTTNIISTDSYLEQPPIEINDYNDEIQTKNDTLILDAKNTGTISSVIDQNSFIDSVYINSSDQDMNRNNSDMEITENTALNKLSQQDISNIGLTPSITTSNIDIDYTKNNTLENILIESQNNDNEDIECLVPNHESPSNIQTLDMTQNINENVLNTENVHHLKNIQEKHNLTPLQNQTKHMHDLVDQATLNDDLHSHPLEYTNIYDEVDFDDTHLAVHDNETLVSSNIHLNEPVFLSADSHTTENNLETSPLSYNVAVPPFEPLHDTASDYTGTHIEIATPKNTTDVNDVSSECITPPPYTTSIVKTVAPETILPNVSLNSAPDLIVSSDTTSKGTVSSTNLLSQSDLDVLSTIHDVDSARLSTLETAPMENSIKPDVVSEVSPMLESLPVIDVKEISVNATQNSLLNFEADSVSHGNDDTICIDKSSITNDHNILDSVSISPDEKPLQIESDILPTSNWYIEQQDPSIITPVSQKADVNSQLKPETSIPTEYNVSDYDFIPETSLLEMPSTKSYQKQTDQQEPLPTIFDHPYIDSVTSNQLPTQTSKAPESKTESSLSAETNTYLEEDFLQIAEDTPLIPPGPVTSLTPESPLEESRNSNPIICQDQKIIDNNVLSDVDLQDHLSAEELQYLSKDELQVEHSLKPSLGTDTFTKVKQSSDLHSKHAPVYTLSTPISLSNYAPSVKADMNEIPELPDSGVAPAKYINSLPNKMITPSSEPILDTPTSTAKPILNRKLSQDQPIILDNQELLAALNNFAKSTETNPLLDEDFERITKDLKSDLTNLLLPETSLADSQLRLPISYSMSPAANEILIHKTPPPLDTSIDESGQSTVNSDNHPSTVFTDSKLQNNLPSTLEPIEGSPYLKEDSLLKPLLPMEIIPELGTDSSSSLQPLSPAEYSEITPAMTHSPVSTSPSVPITQTKDFSIADKSSAKLLPFGSKKEHIDMVPLDIQQDKTPQDFSILASTNELDIAAKSDATLIPFDSEKEHLDVIPKDIQLDMTTQVLSVPDYNHLNITSPNTSPAVVSETTTGLENSYKQLDFTQYEKQIPSKSPDYKKSQFYQEDESLLENMILETKPDHVLTQLNEEKILALKNLIVDTLAPGFTEKPKPLTPLTYNSALTPQLGKDSPPTTYLAQEDSTISRYIPEIESPRLSSGKSTLSSGSAHDMTSRLSETQLKYIPELSSDTEQRNLGFLDDLTNMHVGPEPIVLNQLRLCPMSKLSPLATDTTESLTPQDILKKYEPTHSIIHPSNICYTDMNQFSTAPFVNYDALEKLLKSPPLENLRPLLDRQKLKYLGPVSQQQLPPSASICHTDLQNSFTTPCPSTTHQAPTIPSYSSEYIPQLTVRPSKPIPQLPSSSFYTPLHCTSPVLSKPKPIGPLNSSTLNPNTIIQVPFNPQLHNIPLATSSLSKISQPPVCPQLEFNELPLVISETLDKARPLVGAKVQQNLFTPVSLVEPLSQLKVPCQKVKQTPVTFPDQYREFTIDDRPCIEPSLTLNTNSVPLYPTKILVNEFSFKNIPGTSLTPISPSNYIPISSKLSPNWQGQPSLLQYIQTPEPALDVDFQLGKTNLPFKPCDPVTKRISPTTSKIGPRPEVSYINSHRPIKYITPSSLFTSPYSSINKPLELIPESTKSNVLPNLVSTNYKPKYLNDIAPSMSEYISQSPLIQASKSTIGQERPIKGVEYLTPLYIPICPTNKLYSSTSSPKVNTIGTSLLKNVYNYHMPLKPMLPEPDLISPVHENDLTELPLPVTSVFPLQDISTGLLNANQYPCKPETPVSSLSSRPLDFRTLPTTLSPIKYKTLLDDISSTGNEYVQSIPSQSIPCNLDTSDITSQVIPPCFQNIIDPMLIPTRPVLPLPRPLPTTPSLIYSNSQYSSYPPYSTTPHQLQQPLNLKMMKDNLKISTLPVCIRPMGAKMYQPIIEESVSSTICSKLPSTSYTDLAKLKPQKLLNNAIYTLQPPTYTIPTLLSETEIKPASTIRSYSPLVTPQYTLNPSPYTLPFDGQRFIPMKIQYPIPNVLKSMHSISKPIFIKKSQVLSTPCIPSAITLSNSPQESNPAVVPIMTEYSVLSSPLLSSTPTKPLLTNSVLSSSPLQFYPSSLLPVCVNPMPQYITPILPNNLVSPLKPYPRLSSLILDPASLPKSFPVLPSQPDTTKLLSYSAMPFASQIIPDLPLEAMKPLSVSVKPISMVNSVPILSTYTNLTRLPVDFTSLLAPTGSDKTLSPYTYLPTSVFTKPISVPPCKLSKVSSSSQLPSTLTPVSYVDAAPCSPYFVSKLSRPSVSTQYPICKYLVPTLSPISQYQTSPPQYSIPTVSPISQYQSLTPQYSVPTVPPISQYQSSAAQYSVPTVSPISQYHYSTPQYSVVKASPISQYQSSTPQFSIPTVSSISQYQSSSPQYIVPTVSPISQYQSSTSQIWAPTESPISEYHSLTPQYPVPPVSPNSQYQSSVPQYSVPTLSPISQYQSSTSSTSVPTVSPISQYSISTPISSSIFPAITKPATKEYTTPTSPSTDPVQGYMRPLSQKPLKSLLSESISFDQLSSTPNTALSYSNPNAKPPSYIEPLLPIDIRYQGARPLSQLQKTPCNIPWYGENPLVNEIQNIPTSSNINAMKNLSKYGPSSASSSISNFQIKQNELVNNVIDDIIAPSTETTTIVSLATSVPIEVRKELGKESNKGTRLESFPNISEIDETTKKLLDELLAQENPSPVVHWNNIRDCPNVSILPLPIPLPGAISYKKYDSKLMDVSKLEEGKEMHVNGDSLQEEYYPAVYNNLIKPKKSNLTPLQSNILLLPPQNKGCGAMPAPQPLFWQSSSNSVPIQPTLTLPIKGTSKPPLISSQFASDINSFLESGYSLNQYPSYYKALPLQKQSQLPMISLPYSLHPSTESKITLEQTSPQYTSISSVMSSQVTPHSQVSTVSLSWTPLLSYITPFSKMAKIPPIGSPESYANIPFNSPKYVKPSYTIPWTQNIPSCPSPIPINKYEAPITTYSSTRDSNLSQSKITETPSESMSIITLSNEDYSAIRAPIYSRSVMTPTDLKSTYTTFSELEKPLIPAKPYTTLDAEFEKLQSNKLSPLGKTSKYSTPVETVPYYTTSRYQPSFLPLDLKPNTQFSENPLKIPLTTPLSYAQPEETTIMYETIKPHPQLISKPCESQLNSPNTSPLTYGSPESLQSYKSLKLHPKLLAAYQNNISPSTIDGTSILDTMTLVNTVPETQIPRFPQYIPSVPAGAFPISYSPLLKPLISVKSSETSPTLVPLTSVETSLDNISFDTTELTPINELYSSSLGKSIIKPTYAKESPLKETEVPCDYVEYESQSPPSAIAPSLTNSELVLPYKVSLLKSPLLKTLLLGSQSIPTPPNFVKLGSTPPKQSPLISYYEHHTPPKEFKSIVSEYSNIHTSIPSMLNTVQKSPLTNKYQSYVSMLPFGSQDMRHEIQPPSLFTSPIMYIQPSMTKPLTLTSTDVQSSHPPILEFISPTYSPLVSSPPKSYDTLAPGLNADLPPSFASQVQLISPVSNNTNVLPNKYPSYSEYEHLEPTPLTKVKPIQIDNFEADAAKSVTWSSTPAQSLTPLALSSPDPAISELTAPNYTVSDLKPLPVLTSLHQPNEVSQISSGYPGVSVPMFTDPSPIPIEAKFIENVNYGDIKSPLTPVSSVISQEIVSQSRPLLSSPNVIQYLPLISYKEDQLVKPLTDRLSPVSSNINIASSRTPFLTRPENWLQSAIDQSKPSTFYEMPLDIIPLEENTEIKISQLTPNILTTNMETLKPISIPPGDRKSTPIEPNFAEYIKPVTPLEGPNIKCKTIHPIEMTPYLSDYSPDIQNTETFIKTQTKPKISDTEKIVDEKCVEDQNIEFDKLTLNQIPVIPQYLPSNKICMYSPYTSIDYYNRSPQIKKTTTPTKALHNLLSFNPKYMSEYDNFYTNNHIGNVPKLFNIPIENNYMTQPIISDSSEICNINPVEYMESLPKFETTPLLNEFKTQSLNEFKTPEFQIAQSTSYPIYNSEKICSPCSNCGTETLISPTEICQTPTDFTEIPCKPNSLMPNNEIKYQGYKTYYPCYKNLQSSPISPQPLLYQNQIVNVPNTMQTKLGLDNVSQDLKLHEHIPTEYSDSHKDIDKELNSILNDYVNSKKDLQDKLFNNNAELIIPLGDLAINKKEQGDVKTIETNNPSIGLKVWKSNVKIVTAELKLKFRGLSVNNFMPVVNNLDEFDVEEIRKIVKDYIDEKYGNHIEIHEPYTVSNQYTVLKDFDYNAYDNQFNLLWPAEYV